MSDSIIVIIIIVMKIEINAICLDACKPNTFELLSCLLNQFRVPTLQDTEEGRDCKLALRAIGADNSNDYL